MILKKFKVTGVINSSPWAFPKSNRNLGRKAVVLICKYLYCLVSLSLLPKHHPASVDLTEVGPRSRFAV